MESTAKSMGDLKRLILLWLVFGLLGGVITCLISFLSMQGYFTHWQFVARAPLDFKALQYAAYDSVWIQTTFGDTLRCGSDPEECWIPGVIPPLGYHIETTTCSKNKAAFNFFAHPPRNIQDCVSTRVQYPEASEPFLAVIDQEKNIWSWSQMTGMEILFIPVFAIVGTLVGLVVGTIIWFGRYFLSIRKRTGKTYEPDQKQTRVIRWTMILSSLPFICLISCAILYYFSFYRPPKRNSSNSPLYTAAAGTALARLTEIAPTPQPQLTPEPPGKIIHLVSMCEQITWEFDGEKISCPSSIAQNKGSVQVISTLESLGTESISIYVPASQHYGQFSQQVSAQTPFRIVRAGDHFRASLTHQMNHPFINMVFTVSYVDQSGDQTELGSWRISSEEPTIEVDIDLSHLQGQQISLLLETTNVDDDGRSQTGLWIEPRIEQIIK